MGDEKRANMSFKFPPFWGTCGRTVGVRKLKLEAPYSAREGSLSLSLISNLYIKLALHLHVIAEQPPYYLSLHMTPPLFFHDINAHLKSHQNKRVINLLTGEGKREKEVY